MNKGAAIVMNASEMSSEIQRLRGEVARLQERVAQLDEMAHQDPLVAMPNRRGFERELQRMIARISRYQAKGALLYVDIDGLKIINDSFGHRAGDEALIQVSRLLVEGLRRSDIVARIGGDEFCVLLENVEEAGALETAQRLGDAICDCEFMYEGDALPLSVAIGVAAILAEDSIEDVMARADAEMYRRKAAA
ncbi:MAG: GGDEF domain-containing protein [Sphingomicrobium sp.]